MMYNHQHSQFQGSTLNTMKVSDLSRVTHKCQVRIPAQHSTGMWVPGPHFYKV